MNTFGRIFRITTFGESHGAGVGVLIDGCPAGLTLDFDFLQAELDRRKPGKTRIASQRKENDEFQLLSGHLEGVTTGMPLCFFIPNTDSRTADYSEIAQVFRPSHADFTWWSKYGIHDTRGGGRSSARETAARVIAGAVAKLYLQKQANIQLSAWTESVGEISWAGQKNENQIGDEYTAATACPDAETAKKMFDYIDQIRKEGDSIGGVVACRIKNVPLGLGEPVYGKLQAKLAEAMLSINAAKGFEYGSGFAGTKMRGSEHNDLFYKEGKRIRTHSNYSGGIQGGISNGEDIYFRVAFKPVATILKPQNSLNKEGEACILPAKGRHDPCVVPRAVPVVEAMAACVLADMVLLHKLQQD